MDFSKINLDEHRELARAIVLAAAKERFKNRHDFAKFRNRIIKEHQGTIFHNLHFVKAYEDLLKEKRIEENPHFLRLIQKRSVRTMSGVAPVTVMTKPFPCPGRCVYCPTDVRMPKSYLPSQPAAQRGFRQRFDPYSQVFVRLKALQMTGHEVSKVELRILGGTWSSYTKTYQTWFVKKCLQAMNEFHEQMLRPGNTREHYKKQHVISIYGRDEVSTLEIHPLQKGNISLTSAIKTNETAGVKCIGINIETRPDFIDEAEVARLRELGVTKVEIGVQTTDDHVQELTKRGHDLASVRHATQLLKDAGFKVSYHMMPNLPGSTPEMDKQMIRELFANPAYQPDYLKIYPCVVIPRTPLAMDYKNGEYQPYDDATLEDVLRQNLQDTPEWCRIDRVARDIPSDEIEAGFKASNIREKLEKELHAQGTPCRDIRSREIQDEEYDLSHVKRIIREYQASNGRELFISYEDATKNRLIALLRLRLPYKTFIQELNGAALVREVHVYGKQVAVGKKESGEKQHSGWGMKLLQEAETLAQKSGYGKVAIIAGIGTREYYRKRGYALEGTYMTKTV